MEEIMAITAKQKKAYLKHPGKCPKCKSEDITGASIEIDGDYAVQEVSCSDCEAEWYDYYKLVNVEEIER
jgi:transcription elongation factor Elf1